MVRPIYGFYLVLPRALLLLSFTEMKHETSRPRPVFEIWVQLALPGCT